jgi:hypothetical protein
MFSSSSATAIDSRVYQSNDAHWHDLYTEDSELDDDEKILGVGSEEHDSLLIIYEDSDA